MDNLIRTYEGALSDEQCDYMVAMFEQYPALHEEQANGPHQSLTRLNLMESSHSPFREDIDYIANVFMAAVRKYKDDLELEPFQFPEKFSLEAMKIKRYMPNGKESFPFHVDVNGTHNNLRFLVMFIYLTDNNKGQTTVKPKDDLFVSPCRKGSIILFPPYWPWSHQGEPPIETPKYILGSYLQYA